MSQGGRHPSFDVPDEGVPYVRGEVVRVDDSSGQVRIIRDPNGDHEVVRSRPVAPVVGTPPMRRVTLRRIRH